MEILPALGAALAAALLLFFIPGYLITHSLFRNPARLTIGERWFLPVAVGVVVTTWLALTLAEFGAFSLWALAAGVAILSAAAWLLGRRSGVRWSLRFTRPDWVWLAILLLAILLFARPAEYITGNSDAGTYVNTGAIIARTGGIALHDAEVARLPLDSANTFYWQLINPFMLYKQVRLPGFFIADPAAGLILPQFLHFYPAWLAIWDAVVGVQLGLYATPLIGLLASIAFYFLVRTLALSFRKEPPPSDGDEGEETRTRARNLARLGFFLLIVTVPQFWFARYPVAEAMTQFLVLVGMYAALRMEQLRGGAMGLALLGGAAFGAIFLTRADAVLLLVPLTLYGVALVLARKWRREHWAFFGAFGVLLAQALAHMLVFAPNYLYFQYSHALRMKNIDKLLPGGLPSAEALFSDWRYALLGVGLALAGLVALFVLDRIVQFVWRRRGNELATSWARLEMPLRIAGAAGVVIVVVLAYFVFPRAESLYAYVGGATPSDSSANLIKLGWYLSPIGIFLATFGAALVMLCYLRARNVLFFGSAALFSVFYLEDLYSNPHYIYTTRHYIPLVIPLCIVLAACALQWLSLGGGTWVARRLPNERRRTRIGRLAAGGILTLWMLYTLYAMGVVDGSRANGLALRLPLVSRTMQLGPVRLEPFENSMVGVQELGGAYAQIQALDKALPDNAVIIFSAGRDEPAILATPLKFIFGRDAFVTIFNNPPPTKVAAMVDGWREQGREVILAYGTNGGRLDLPGYALERIGEAAFNVPQWAFAYDFMPRSAWRVNLNYGLYRAVPQSAPEPYPYVLDFGGDDYPALMSGFLERAPEASTRWIGVIAANSKDAGALDWLTGRLRVPAHDDGKPLAFTLRARAPRADVRLAFKSGEHTLGGAELSPDWADYTVYASPSELTKRGDYFLLDLVVEPTPDGQGRVLGAELESLRVAEAE